MDIFLKKLLKIIIVKILLIIIIYFIFFNKPALSTDPQIKQQQIQTHFLTSSEKNND